MSRYFSIAEQSQWDSKVSGAANQKFFDIASEDISPENNLLIYETAATRYPPGAGAGPYRSTGGVDSFVETSAFGSVLKMALGQEDTISATTINHIFHPVSSLGNFKYFTSLINFDYPDGYRLLKNAAIGTLEIEATAGELVSFSCDVIGAEETVSGIAPTPTYSQVPFATYHHGSVTMDGSSITSGVESFSVSLDNNLADDALVLGRRDLPAVRSQALTVEGSMDWSFDDFTMYERFFGAGGAQTPQSTISGMDLQFSLYVSASEGGTMSQDHELTVYVPNAKVDTTDANIDDRDRIVEGVDFVGVGGTVTIDGTDYDSSVVISLDNEQTGTY